MKEQKQLQIIPQILMKFFPNFQVLHSMNSFNTLSLLIFHWRTWQSRTASLKGPSLQDQTIFTKLQSDSISLRTTGKQFHGKFELQFVRTLVLLKNQQVLSGGMLKIKGKAWWRRGGGSLIGSHPECRI